MDLEDSTLLIDLTVGQFRALLANGAEAPAPKKPARRKRRKAPTPKVGAIWVGRPGSNYSHRTLRILVLDGADVKTELIVEGDPNTGPRCRTRVNRPGWMRVQSLRKNYRPKESVSDFEAWEKVRKWKDPRKQENGEDA